MGRRCLIGSTALILDEFSLAHILLKEVVPPLITVLLGGFLASVLFPRWQDNYSRSRSREERKRALAEQLSKYLEQYMSSWDRLRTIAELETTRERGLTEIELERKQRYVNERDEANSQLKDTMSSAVIYFTDETALLLEDFNRWDQACRAKRVDELPSRTEFNVWKSKLVKGIHEELER